MLKRYLFALLLSYSYSAFLSAQNFPFPTADAEWITTWITNCIGGSLVYNVWRDNIGGDTVIQQKVYKKIYYEPECHLVTQGVHCYYFYIDYQIEAYPVGGLRVENQRVYFQKFDSVSVSDHLRLMPAGIEILLYDFNWQIGDTLKAPLDNGDPNFFKVTNISTLPNGRKQFTMTHFPGIGYPLQIIEGAGTTVGLFGCYANFFNTLDCCFNHNGSVVLTGPDCQICGSVDVVPEPSERQMNVYPNPASDEINISLVENTIEAPKSCELKIYNLQGQSLYEDLNFSGKARLSVAKWPAQTWILIVLRNPSTGRSWTEKVQLER